MEANKNSIDVGQEKNENEDQLRKELKEAHIESTHNLFINCCRHFEDYPKISSFLKYADIFSTYESHVEEFVTKFQGDIKIKNRKKKEIQKFCLEKMKQAERKAEKESISLIELYKKEEKRVFRALEKQQRDDSQNKIDFGKPEDELKKQISELQANLMDVEIKLQQALTVSKNAFLSQVSALNDEMGQDQTKLFQEVNGKVSEFKGKLIEELNREKDDFQERFGEEEDDEDGPIRDYENMPAKDEIYDLLIDGENKDAVDELINSFTEKLEAKLQEEESYISRLRKSE